MPSEERQEEERKTVNSEEKRSIPVKRNENGENKETES